VQTCALPICPKNRRETENSRGRRETRASNKPPPREIIKQCLIVHDVIEWFDGGSKHHQGHPRKPNPCSQHKLQIAERLFSVSINLSPTAALRVAARTSSVIAGQGDPHLSG